VAQQALATMAWNCTLLSKSKTEKNPASLLSQIQPMKKKEEEERRRTTCGSFFLFSSFFFFSEIAPEPPLKATTQLSLCHFSRNFTTLLFHFQTSFKF